MKNRNLWFISFYILLSTFIFYQLLFLFSLMRNHELKALLHVSDFHNNNLHVSSNYFCVFQLPLIGTIISSCALISFIAINSIFCKKTAYFKFYLLIFNFIIFIIGFFLNFTAELFYSEWSSLGELIISDSDPVFGYNYYNWLPSWLIWSIFGGYFGLLIGAVILLIKLNIINIQESYFYRQQVVAEEFIPELKQPLPSSNEFNPNETQTITILLDDEQSYKDNKQKKIKKFKN